MDVKEAYEGLADLIENITHHCRAHDETNGGSYDIVQIGISLMVVAGALNGSIALQTALGSDFLVEMSDLYNAMLEHVKNADDEEQKSYN